MTTVKVTYSYNGSAPVEIPLIRLVKPPRPETAETETPEQATEAREGKVVLPFD